MVNPVVGSGQVYMTTKRDSQGEMLQAGRTYRLRVPKDVPAAQFWGLTLYSEQVVVELHPPVTTCSIALSSPADVTSLAERGLI